MSLSKGLLLFLFGLLRSGYVSFSGMFLFHLFCLNTMQDFRFLEMDSSTACIKLNKDAVANVITVYSCIIWQEPVSCRRMMSILYSVTPKPGRESVANQQNLF